MKKKSPKQGAVEHGFARKWVPWRGEVEKNPLAAFAFDLAVIWLSLEEEESEEKEEKGLLAGWARCRHGEEEK